VEKQLWSDVSAFEQKLGLKQGFYDSLLESDDWSFVIKLNALFEAACTEALVARLGCPEISENLSHLEFSDNRKGKVRILFELGALVEIQRSILHALAQLRNELVHRIKNVSFSFAEHFATFNEAKLKSQCELWGNGLHETLTVEGKTVSRSDFVRGNPKLAIWLTCSEILACLHLEFEKAEARERNKRMDGYYEFEEQLCSRIPALRDLPSVLETFESSPAVGLLDSFLRDQFEEKPGDDAIPDDGAKPA
jgi:hypothetical protein